MCPPASSVAPRRRENTDGGRTSTISWNGTQTDALTSDSRRKQKDPLILPTIKHPESSGVSSSTRSPVFADGGLIARRKQPLITRSCTRTGRYPEPDEDLSSLPALKVKQSDTSFVAAQPHTDRHTEDQLVAQRNFPGCLQPVKAEPQHQRRFQEHYCANSMAEDPPFRRPPVFRSELTGENGDAVDAVALQSSVSTSGISPFYQGRSILLRKPVVSRQQLLQRSSESLPSRPAEGGGVISGAITDARYRPCRRNASESDIKNAIRLTKGRVPLQAQCSEGVLLSSRASVSRYLSKVLDANSATQSTMSRRSVDLENIRYALMHGTIRV
jgi:hypothetical protein